MSSGEVVRGYTTRPNKIAESDRSRLRRPITNLSIMAFGLSATR
jgi:hypothetical protein